MAVYRIYPDKDATLYSEIPYSNTGADEILELGAYVDNTGVPRVSRIVLSFDNEELREIVNSKIQGPFSSSLRLFLAEASEIPTQVVVEAYPIGQEWTEGVGKFGDTPTDTSGVSWWTRQSSNFTTWNTDGTIPSISSYVSTGYVSTDYVLSQDISIPITGSFDPLQPGGGSWYSEEVQELNQSINRRDSLDLNINITEYINKVYSQEITDNGILLKLQDSIEFNEHSNTRLKYYSVDTNTIYSPCLELKWKDTDYQIENLPVLETSNFSINLKNNKTKYNLNEVIKFRLSCKPKYPTRTFTTSSIYLDNYALPENTCWSIVDEYTNETVIEFDEKFTNVGCDNNGPYFTVFMSALSPERFYNIQVKTEIDGNSQVTNVGTFKVIKYE
jgi:hypothetical protein